MNSVDLFLKMDSVKDSFDPPLTISEMLEFAFNPCIPTEELYWSPRKKGKTTKKEIKKEIVTINRQIGEWMERTRKDHYPYLIVEKLVEKKHRLYALLTPKKDLTAVKRIPITGYIHFTGGFAKCIWHDEKSASLKYYPKTNTVYCFGCHKNGDVIDVVQQLNNCSFSGAMSILQNAIS